MKISLFTNGIYPYVMGGMQKHSYNLAKYFAQNRIYVDLYHYVQFDQPLADRLIGFSDEELKFINNICFHFEKPGRYPGHYVLRSYNYSKKIYKSFLNKKNVDFVYAQGFTGWYYTIQKKKDLSLPPIAVNFHGLEMFQKSPTFYENLKHLIFKLPVNYISKSASFNYSLGGKLSTILKNLAPNTKIIERPNAISEDWLFEPSISKENKVRKFVFLGRYVRHKGIQELTRVIKNLSLSYDFEFNFIGPIPKSKKIINNKVIYHGEIKDETGDALEIKEILRDSDYLVCPSYSEGMPTVILEAMASGCSIIASDVGAVQSMVDETNGWLITAGNQEELQKTILKAIIIEDKDLKQKKENSIQKVKKNFTWDIVISSTINDIVTFCKKENRNINLSRGF